MTSRPLDQQERDWQELAELDPYWAILTAPGTRFGGWDSQAFFATGSAEIEAVMRRAATFGCPNQHRKALDFGCGVGRVSRALTRYFDECVGVDISETMIQRARELNRNVTGVSFIVNRTADLSAFEDSSFDFVYSVIVLQHVADRRAIESYVTEFCRVLRPGGLIVFQIPSHIPAVFRLQWRRRLYLGGRRLGLGAAFLYRRLRLFPIAMTYMPEQNVTKVLEAAGAQLLEVESERASGLLNTGVKSNTYWATL